MTESSPRPNRRWRRLVVGLALFAIVAGLLTYRSNRQQRAVRDWFALLNAGSLFGGVRKETSVPAFERIPFARQLLGRETALIFIVNDDDARHLLHIPECPMPIRVTTNRRVSTGLRDRIRDRYGAENVE